MFPIKVSSTLDRFSPGDMWSQQSEAYILRMMFEHICIHIYRSISSFLNEYM